MAQQAVNPIIEGFNRLGDQLVGAIRRSFGTMLDNAEETHYLIMVNADNLNQGFLPLAGAAAGQGLFMLGADADFVAVAIMQRAPTQADPNAVDQSFTWVLRDGSTQRDFSNYPVHSQLGTGNGQFPFYFPKPRIFSRNSQIQIEIVNLSAAATNIYMALLGYKIYDETMMDLTSPK